MSCFRPEGLEMLAPYYLWKLSTDSQYNHLKQFYILDCKYCSHMDDNKFGDSVMLRNVVSKLCRKLPDPLFVKLAFHFCARQNASKLSNRWWCNSSVAMEIVFLTFGDLKLLIELIIDECTKQLCQRFFILKVLIICLVKGSNSQPLLWLFY